MYKQIPATDDLLYSTPNFDNFIKKILKYFNLQFKLLILHFSYFTYLKKIYKLFICKIVLYKNYVVFQYLILSTNLKSPNN